MNKRYFIAATCWLQASQPLTPVHDGTKTPRSHECIQLPKQWSRTAINESDSCITLTELPGRSEVLFLVIELAALCYGCTDVVCFACVVVCCIAESTRPAKLCDNKRNF